jgi:hypothetical protein
MSKIVKIEEVNNVNFNDNRYSNYDGFKIETEDEEIYFVIDNSQQCCENWGTYLYTPEDLREYVGADYLGYDESSCSEIENHLENEYVESDEICFLNIHTSKGTIDFAVYNSHNGYYSHAVVLKITNKKTGETSMPINDYL